MPLIGFATPLVRIPRGQLERIIDDVHDQAREPLLWQVEKLVIKAHNAPLYLNPQILDEVLK